MLRWPVLVSMAVLIGLVLRQTQQNIIVLVELLTIIALGWLASNRRAQPVEGLTVGALAGLGLGFAIAVAKLIHAPSFPAAANLVAESMWTGIFGSLIAVCTLLIQRIFNR